ncbi:MAG: hypothetical protein ACFFBD_29065, partial [Candidatus Hodarchaeota archaeon]
MNLRRYLTLTIDFIPCVKKNRRFIGNYPVQEISSIFESGEYSGKTFLACEKDGLTFADHILMEKRYYINCEFNIQPPTDKFAILMSLWLDDRQVGPIFPLNLNTLKIRRFRASRGTCDILWFYSCIKSKNLQHLLDSAVRSAFFSVLTKYGTSARNNFLTEVKEHRYASRIYNSLLEEMNVSDWV